MKKLIFFGQGDNAAKTLKTIYESKLFNILLVVPRLKNYNSKKPVNNKFFDDGKLTSLSKKLKIKIVIEKKINSKLFIRKIKLLNSDLIINYGHGSRFSRELLNGAKFGCLNYHPGLLPYGRGPGALVGEILNGSKHIGRTCHLMDDNFDKGRIIRQNKYLVKDKNMGELEKTLMKDVDKFILQSIKDVFMKKKLKKIREFGRYFPKFVEGDNYIDWNCTSLEIYRKIKSRLPSTPSLAFIKDDLEEIKIVKASIEKKIKPYISVNGQIIDKSKRGILVKTKDTAIWIELIRNSKNSDIIPNFKIGTCFEKIDISFVINILKRFRKIKSNE